MTSIGEHCPRVCGDSFRIDDCGCEVDDGLKALVGLAYSHSDALELFEFAEEIFKQAKLLVKVNYISSDNYQTKAKRPKNSRLSKSELEKNGFKKLPIWQDALRRYLSELQC